MEGGGERERRGAAAAAGRFMRAAQKMPLNP